MFFQRNDSPARMARMSAWACRIFMNGVEFNYKLIRNLCATLRSGLKAPASQQPKENGPVKMIFTGPKVLAIIKRKRLRFSVAGCPVLGSVGMARAWRDRFG